jgi:rRNA-processing protein FCF1
MIVLDINCYHLVFQPKSNSNDSFYYIHQWVTKEKCACFVYGGTKYKCELEKIPKYHKIINQLKNAGKFIEINAQMIDENARQLKIICSDTNFDDEHIIAILNISGCKLVCTKDIKAQEYIKRKDFYSDKKVPRIYSKSKHKRLLRKKYIITLKNRC